MYRVILKTFESLFDGVAVFNARDPNIPIMCVNPNFATMIDRDEQAFKNSTLDDFLNIFFLEETAKKAFLEQAEHEDQSKDWSYKESRDISFYRIHLSLMKDENNASDIYILTLKNVTESRNKEMRIAEFRKLEALGQLAGGVAHDFNNILSIIDGYSRMASKKINDLGRDGDVKEITNDISEYISKVRQAAKRGANLTKQLLLFGSHRIVGETVIDLKEMLVQQHKLMKPLLGTNVDLDISVAPDLFVSSLDDSLSQIVMNLVINARDAMPDGGVVGLNAVKATAKEIKPFMGKDEREDAIDYIRISITDTGFGMSEDTLSRLFEPFFTTKEQGKGTGLGMPMVYGLIRDMKGFIDVKSELGKGTTILIYLPASQEKRSKNISISADNEAGYHFEGYTILVAEDEPELLLLMESTLADMGFEVLVAHNGNQALLVQDEHEGDIDLLLTDIVMPEMDGIKLADLFQALRDETSVIFMSGFPANGKMSNIKLPEDSVLLAKPVDLSKLAKVMRIMLDEKDSMSTAGLTQWGKAMTSKAS